LALSVKLISEGVRDRNLSTNYLKLTVQSIQRKKIIKIVEKKPFYTSSKFTKFGPFLKIKFKIFMAYKQLVNMIILQK
jgi:hypothetical protein